MTQPAVRMENISKTFPGVRALKGVSFSIEKGEIHAIVGENGAGKSTLIKILMGVYSRDKASGAIYIDGAREEIDSPLKAEAIGLAAVYQHMMLARELTVAENIFLGRQPVKGAFVDWAEMNRMAREELEIVGLSAINPEAKVRELTPVQQEMVAIAKAISRNAKIIILDEPTALLAEAEVKELHGIMRRLKTKGIAIIYISHRLDEIFTICDRVTVLRDGSMVGTSAVSDLTEADLIRQMVGRDINELYYKEEIGKGKELLRVEHLERKPKVIDASFSVHEGEVLGIFGLVGSGRTELVRCLFGADRPTSGRVLIGGQEVDIKGPSDSIQHNLGLIPEDRLTQGVALPLDVQANTNLISSRKWSKLGFLNFRRERETTQANIEDLSIRTPSPYQKVKFLSGGNQQKVVIAKWLNIDAEILIFDEPTVGIDVGAKTEIYKLMARLLQQKKGIIFISSYLPELLGICDRIMVISEGRVEGIVDAQTATQERLLALASLSAMNIQKVGDRNGTEAANH